MQPLMVEYLDIFLKVHSSVQLNELKLAYKEQEQTRLGKFHLLFS